MHFLHFHIHTIHTYVYKTLDMNDNDDSNKGVFEYRKGLNIPKDVVYVRCHSSVTKIGGVNWDWTQVIMLLKDVLN